MHGLDVRSRPRNPDRTTRLRLDNLDAYLRWVWPALPAPMTREWSDSPVVALNQGAPWIYRPVNGDPSGDSRGGIVLPRKVRARLKQLTKWRVPFHRLAIAHELDWEGPIREWLLTLQAGPQPCTDEEAVELVGDAPAHPWLTRAVRVLDRAVGGATLVAGRPASLVRTVLEQIVFGIVAPQPPRHGDLCLWYPLAAWRW